VKISEHLSLSELIRSESAKRLGLSNMPTPDHIINLKVLADNIFEPIREHFRCPIHISSGYRSAELNHALKGASKTSQHLKGEAIDIDMDGSSNGVTNAMVFEFIVAKLKFDQLIWEHGDTINPAWVHVSYKKNGPQRHEILRAVMVDGGTKYIKVS
jgi:zinc D-Ala-D-Ala carboxypeptidase